MKNLQFKYIPFIIKKEVSFFSYSMDNIDQQIAALLQDDPKTESSSKSGFAQKINIKNVGISWGVSLVISVILTYAIKPKYTLDFQIKAKKSKRKEEDEITDEDTDEEDEDIEQQPEKKPKVEVDYKINKKHFAIFSIVFSFVLLYPVYTMITPFINAKFGSQTTTVGQV